MRWIPGIVGAAVVLGLSVGCTKQSFVDRDAFYQAHHLPTDLEENPEAGVHPLSEPIGTPPDIDHPDRPPRYLSLEEAFAIALEYGATQGRVILGQEGISNDSLITLPVLAPLNFIGQIDRIRVLALNPA